MTGVLQSPDSVVRADCEDCEWSYERSLEAGDGLSVDDNREIAARVVRNHAHKCGADDERDWGDTADVATDLTAAPGSGEQ